MSANEVEYPVWRRPMQEEEDLEEQAEHLRRRHLLLDPKFPWAMNDDALKPMYQTGLSFWVVVVALSGLVLMGAVTWARQIYWGLGITGLNRPIYWGLFLVNTVYFIGMEERIELTHRAASRDTFARGAVRAMEFVIDKKPGLYTMFDVLGI